MGKIGIVFVLVIVLLMCSCTTEAGNMPEQFVGTVATYDTSDNVTPQVTCSAINGNALEAFDISYDNLSCMYSTLIYDNDKLYYTDLNFLYCYDIAKKRIDIISSEIIAENIYLYDGNVLYLENNAIYCVNTESNEIKSMITAKNLQRDIYAGYNITTEAVFVNYSLYNDTLAIKLSASIYDWTEEGLFTGVISLKTDEIIAKYTTCLGEHINIELEEKKVNDNTKAFTFAYDNSDNLIAISADTFGYAYDWFSQTGYTSSSGSLVTSKNEVYYTNYPLSSQLIRGVDLNTFEDVFTKDLNSALAKPMAINQYIIIYYYNRHGVENIGTTEGVIFVDTKNNRIYENEEINSLIDGESDYKIFMNSTIIKSNENIYLLKKSITEEVIPQGTELLPQNEYAVKYRDRYIIKGENEKKSKDYVFYRYPALHNIYKAEIIDGKLHFTLLYKEFD